MLAEINAKCIVTHDRYNVLATTDGGFSISFYFGIVTSVAVAHFASDIPLVVYVSRNATTYSSSSSISAS